MVHESTRGIAIHKLAGYQKPRKPLCNEEAGIAIELVLRELEMLTDENTLLSKKSLYGFQNAINKCKIDVIGTLNRQRDVLRCDVSTPRRVGAASGVRQQYLRIVADTPRRYGATTAASIVALPPSPADGRPSGRL
ncbi:hypothetical protein ALC53_07860 [Atta colombica]|uniref:Uncharacterized protein n=1 Tax=Atta colombica TaxID=520822 RepID=A0A195BBV2_9HYME|nr:hypothetical protein ALC53_07860 [Atta colombica]